MNKKIPTISIVRLTYSPDWRIPCGNSKQGLQQRVDRPAVQPNRFLSEEMIKLSLLINRSLARSFTASETRAKPSK